MSEFGYSADDFQVGAEVVKDIHGNIYCVDEETIAVLFDENGTPCDLTNTYETADHHTGQGFGRAIALKDDGFRSKWQMQKMFDQNWDIYLDYIGA